MLHTTSQNISRSSDDILFINTFLSFICTAYYDRHDTVPLPAAIFRDTFLAIIISNILQHRIKDFWKQNISSSMKFSIKETFFTAKVINSKKK